jgi:hypothetical protein
MTNMAVIIFMYHIRLVCAANILYPPYIQTRKAIRNFICSHSNPHRFLKRDQGIIVLIGNFNL